MCVITGGLLAHSLAVVSDAAHLLTDFASFMISLVALYLVSRPATKRLSFGWHRAGQWQRRCLCLRVCCVCVCCVLCGVCVYALCV